MVAYDGQPISHRATPTALLVLCTWYRPNGPEAFTANKKPQASVALGHINEITTSVVMTHTRTLSAKKDRVSHTVIKKDRASPWTDISEIEA